MSSSNLSFPKLQLSTTNIETLSQDGGAVQISETRTHTLTPTEEDVHSITSELSLNDDNWSDDEDDRSYHELRDELLSDEDDEFELLDVESTTNAQEDENSQQLAASYRA